MKIKILSNAWRIVSGIVLLTAAMLPRPGFSCDKCLMDSETATSVLGKCGYTIDESGEGACEGTDPPTVFLHFYRNITESDDEGDSDDYTVVDYITDPTLAGTWDSSACGPLWIGPVDSTYNETITDPSCSTTGTGHDSDGITSWADPDCAASWGINSLGSIISSTVSCTGNSYTLVGTWDNGSSSVSDVYSSVYTDPKLATYASSLCTTFSDWSAGSGSAYFHFCDESHLVANAGKMQYRLKIPGSSKGVSYKVKWFEVTTYDSGSTSSVPKYETIIGTGDPVNPALGTVHSVDVPLTPCTITDSSATIISQK
jgi:hypothetical protein